MTQFNNSGFQFFNDQDLLHKQRLTLNHVIHADTAQETDTVAFAGVNGPWAAAVTEGTRLHSGLSITQEPLTSCGGRQLLSCCCKAQRATPHLSHDHDSNTWTVF